MTLSCNIFCPENYLHFMMVKLYRSIGHTQIFHALTKRGTNAKFDNHYTCTLLALSYMQDKFYLLIRNLRKYR